MKTFVAPTSNRRDAVLGFGLVLVVLLIGGAMGYVNASRLADDSRWVTHSHEVIEELETLLSTLKDAETGQRGYLLTEDEQYLEPYNDALKRVPREVTHLKDLTSDNPAQQARVVVLEGKIDGRFDELKQTIALMKKGDRAAATAIVHSGSGKAHMDELRREIAGIQRSEGELLRKRAEESDASYRTTLLSITLSSVIGMILVGIVFYLSQRSSKLRERAAHVIAEQAERLRTTLASIGDAVITTDTGGRITNMNAVAQTLTGWTDDEAAGQPLGSVFHIVNETTRQPVDNPALRALQEGAIVGLANHTVLIAKNGSERPIDDSAAPIRCRAGEIVGCVLVFRDISDRKRAEDLLRESEARYRAIGESIDFGVWMCDAEGRNTYASESFLHLVGLTQEQCSGFGWAAVLHPDDAAATMAAWKECVRTGGTWDREQRFKGVDGQWHHVLARGVPLRNKEGRVLGWAGINLDISRIKQAEDQFHVMADNIPQLAWMAHPNGDIYWYNRRWYEYTGTTPELQAGWGWQSVHDPVELPKVLERWKECIASGDAFDMVFPLKGADGVFRPFLTRIMPVKDAAGRVLQWFGTSTDIQEQKRIAEELRKLTAELSEADHRKNEFLATLAHELRNPLAPIRNGLQILRLSSGSGVAVEEARTMMERQLGQMVHLVDDLLDVSRISRGKLDLRKEPVDLGVVLKNAVETSKPLIESCSHELTVIGPRQPVFVDADAARLGQVFANLLNNAAKYSEHGGHIRLTAERQGSDVAVSVKDTGVGIPPEMLPKIFEMFTQVDRSLERAQGGLGIGLTLVKRLVELHGGTVEARSAGQGKGSEFIVRLPVILAAAPERKPVGVEGEPACPPGQCRILVADDNADSATSLAIMLRIMGNEVRTANDGLEAVEAAAAFQPDVILLDIGMPKLNGYEACRRIREQPWGKKVVLVALTGWGQDEDKRRSQEAGFDHHIVKPVDPDSLEKLLASRKTAPA